MPWGSHTERMQINKTVTHPGRLRGETYPCQICTKTFVSHDALNLHISRKHMENLAKNGERTDPSNALNKEDLTLINTIKMQLEIKQLKERLSLAEAQIVQNNMLVFTSQDKEKAHHGLATNNEDANNEKHSIGVQANICDTKERIEQTDLLCKACENHCQQITILQEKVLHLSEKREERCDNNGSLLAGIDIKLNDINRVLNIQQERAALSSGYKQLKHAIEDAIANVERSTIGKLHEINTKLDASRSKLSGLGSEVLALKTLARGPNQCNCNQTNSSRTRLDVQPTIPAYNSIVKTNMHPAELYFPTQTSPEVESNNSKNNELPSVRKATITSVNDVQRKCEMPSKERHQGSCTKRKSGSVYKSSTETASAEKCAARRLAITDLNKVLESFGIERWSNVLNTQYARTVSKNLSKSRCSHYNKHTFLLTRISLQEFVDKLCSLRMPEGSHTLLQAINDIEDSAKIDYTYIKQAKVNPPEENDLEERIDKDPTVCETETSNQHVNFQKQVPIPMPRKKVVFDSNSAKDKVNY